MRPMRVYIQKPDLDTCLTALVLGVNGEALIYIGRGDADTATLDNPAFICIEAGGNGQVQLGNFDHHDPEQYWPPACHQALDFLGTPNPTLARLVEYVCAIDEARILSPIPFPSLSTIFSGMLLCESDPERQFLQGVKILSTVMELQLDPFGTMPELHEWKKYRQAKISNRKRLSTLLESAQYHRTNGGQMIGVLQFPPASKIIGGIKTLYDNGAQVVLLYDPTFGFPSIQKFTIAGNGVDVSILLPALNNLEKGWGGRETIIGSPRSGSVLRCEEMVDLLIRML